MNNEIQIDDVKMWLGELVLENRIMQKELMRLKVELEEIKRGLLESNPQRKEGKGNS